MSYLVVVAVTIAIYAVLTVSLNIVIGYAGQPHLGHGAFFGIGAYFGAVLTTTYSWSFWASVPVSAVAAGLSGLLVGAVSLRLRDDFLAITTIGLNFVVVAAFQYIPWFGGPTGIYAIPLPQIGGYSFENVGFLVLALLLLALVVGLSLFLRATWFGLGLFGVKDDDLAAATVGIPVAPYKVVAFTLAATLAGLAGTIYGPFLSVVTPSSFGFTESVVMVAMLMFGGLGSIRGAVLGAVVLGALPEVFRFASDYRLLIFGLVLVLTLRFRPQGLIGSEVGRQRTSRLLAWRPGVRRTAGGEGR
jgi:branched-chain amino acid transport system permease protein